jgi:hypothetical protein
VCVSYNYKVSSYPNGFGRWAKGHVSGPYFFIGGVMKRTIVYVDGFNLYYRALKNTKYKWLDIADLCQKAFSEHNEIVGVKYFTAKVRDTKSDPLKSTRQDVYLRALKTSTVPIEIIYGHYSTNITRARLVTPINGIRSADIHKTEEKGSDVNFAVHLLNDSWLDNFDCAIVISNDSDICEAMRLVKEQNNKLIGLFSPVVNPLNDLKKHSSFVRSIRKKQLWLSQFPDTIKVGNKSIVKPQGW